MPGRNNGTGRPLTARCSRCRKSRYQNTRGKMGWNLEATGRVRPLPSSRRCNMGSRVLPFEAEYRCLDCGHVGWSRHADLLPKLTACDAERMAAVGWRGPWTWEGGVTGSRARLKPLWASARAGSNPALPTKPLDARCTVC